MLGRLYIKATQIFDSKPGCWFRRRPNLSAGRSKPLQASHSLR